MQWVREVKHLGNFVTSHITDERDCKMFQTYCCSFYGSELWVCNSNGFNRCITEWNKALRRIMRIPYGSFHVNSTNLWMFFHGPPRIVLKFGTVVEHG